jgi:small subunit ribosomal protein S18
MSEKKEYSKDGGDRPQGGKFTSFGGGRQKVKMAKTAAGGKYYVDYKDTETLRRLLTSNGKIQSRKRTGANAMEQRMLSTAVKRARYMALLPYVATSA